MILIVRIRIKEFMFVLGMLLGEIRTTWKTKVNKTKVDYDFIVIQPIVSLRKDTNMSVYASDIVLS